MRKWRKHGFAKLEEKMIRKQICVLGLVLLLIPGCKTKAKQPGADVTVTPGANTEITTTPGADDNPIQKTAVYGGTAYFAAVTADEITKELFLEGLFTRDEKRAIAPAVAASYEVNADATVYTISLREGMRWSDGVPFTADDCLFYYNYLCVPKATGNEIPACFLGSDGKRATFEKVSQSVFRVKFTARKANFIEEMTDNGILCFAPEHYYVNLLPEFMGEDAAKAKAADMGYSDVKELLSGVLAAPWNTKAVPTLCPFVLSTAEGENDVKGASYVFVRNPYYWKKDASGNALPYLDRLEFTRISGDAQGMLLTQEGYLSLYRLQSRTQCEEANQLASHGKYHVIDWGGGWYFAVADNLHGFPQVRPPQVQDVSQNSPAGRLWGSAQVESWYITGDGK